MLRQHLFKLDYIYLVRFFILFGPPCDVIRDGGRGLQPADPRDVDDKEI